MKKIIAILLIALTLTGCGAKVEKASGEETSRFTLIELTGRWEVVADKETGVMYAVSNGGYNLGTFTMLVDEEGKPLIWKGEIE